MNKIYLVFLIILLFVFVGMWFNDHDKKVMEGADVYEACVRAEYGVSPSFYYQEHGEYPECK